MVVDHKCDSADFPWYPVFLPRNFDHENTKTDHLGLHCVISLVFHGCTLFSSQQIVKTPNSKVIISFEKLKSQK